MEDTAEAVTSTHHPHHSPRKPWRAGLLSFLLPGLGQLYNGEIPRALGMWAGIILVSLSSLMISVWLLPKPINIITPLVVYLIVFIWNIVDAVKQGRKKRQYLLKKYNRWYIYLAALVIGIFLPSSLIKDVGIEAFVIKTKSMENSMLSGDYFLACKFSYDPRIPLIGWHLPALTRPKPGDLLLLKNPQDPKASYVKRCVAVGGQMVELRDKQLLIDGQAEQPSPNLKWEDENNNIPASTSPRDNFGPYLVPVGHLFVLGDNRDSSYDSRFFGPVTDDDIIGNIMLVHFSMDKDASGLSSIRWERIGIIPE